MKKLLLSIIILMGGGVFYNAFGQQQIPMHIIDNGYFNYGVLIRNKNNCPPDKGTTTTISIIISLS